MRNYFLILIILIITSCSNNQKSEQIQFEFIGEFDVDVLSKNIAVDTNNEYLYTSTGNKIQKYNLHGDMINTFLDYSTDSNGNYEYYVPKDLVVDGNNNVLILTTPHYLRDDGEWFPYKGFCVMVYNENGELKNEYDFANLEEYYANLVLAYHNEFIYVAYSGKIQKINTINNDIVDIELSDENIGIYVGDGIPITDLISGMAIDSDDNIWLVGESAASENMIGCFMIQFSQKDKSYLILNSKGETSHVAAELNNPDIMFDEYDNFYLATGYCKSIEIYTKKKKIQQEIKIDQQYTFPTDIKIDKDNNLYVLDGLNGKILIYGVE